MNNAAATEIEMAENYGHELELAEAEQAWHDYAQARLARAGGLLDEALERASRASVPAIHLRELESAAREAAEVIKLIGSNEQ